MSSSIWARPTGPRSTASASTATGCSTATRSRWGPRTCGTRRSKDRDRVPDSLLAILKVVFLGLLYLFFLRVLRAVWIELREPKTVQVAAVPPAPAPQPAPRSERRRRGGSKADRLVVLEPPERRAQAFELGDELTVGRAPGCGVA